MMAPIDLNFLSMSFPSNGTLHYSRNVFSSLFNMMSREVLDGQGGNLVFFMAMNFKNTITIYADKAKQQPLLECVKPTMLGFEWDVLDKEAGGQPIGHMKMNVLTNIASFGRESWTITAPGGAPLLAFESDKADGIGKRILDNMSDLYNPTHQYNLYGASNNPVARIFAKHGIFRMTYDMVLEPKVTDTERKMAVAVFAALILLLKK